MAMTGNANDPAAVSWHVDKRIPIVLVVSVIVGIVGQSVAIGAWTAYIQGQVNAHTLELSRRSIFIDRFITLENELKNLKENTLYRLESIDRKLDEISTP